MKAGSRPALFLLCVVPALSQAPAAPEISAHDVAPTFNTKVNLIMVPVVVLDKKGNAIGTFQKEDFQLFDRGKPRVISKFTVERAEGKVEITASDPAAQKDAAKNPESPPAASRFVAYLFDDMHVRPGLDETDLTQPGLVRSEKAAVKYLEKSMKPIDRAAIFTTSGQNVLDFTDDRVKLEETMNKIRPHSRQEEGGCPDISDYIADLILNKNDKVALAVAIKAAIDCKAVRREASQQQKEAVAIDGARRVLNLSEMDVQVTMSVLKAAVQRIAAMPGQRTIVLVSPGFLITDSYRNEETELMDRAIRANVTISTLDSLGLNYFGGGTEAMVKRAVLGELADGTGGTAFDDSNDLEEGFRRTSAMPEVRYMLGFSPENLKFDGKYHALKVTLKDVKGVTVTARRGYDAPKHSGDAAEDAKEEIRGALFSRDEIADIPVDLHTQYSKPTDRSAKISILARVNLEHVRFKKTPDGRHQNTLSIVSAVFDRNGILVNATQKDIELRFKDETFETRIGEGVSMKTSFDVTPGSYIVRLVVRDSEGQTMAARNGVIDIP